MQHHPTWPVPAALISTSYIHLPEVSSTPISTQLACFKLRVAAVPDRASTVLAVVVDDLVTELGIATVCQTPTVAYLARAYKNDEQ